MQHGLVHGSRLQKGVAISKALSKPRCSISATRFLKALAVCWSGKRSFSRYRMAKEKRQLLTITNREVRHPVCGVNLLCSHRIHNAETLLYLRRIVIPCDLLHRRIRSTTHLPASFSESPGTMEIASEDRQNQG